MALQGVVIGAGDVGMRLARMRAAAGDRVSALRRRALPVADGVHAVAGDLHRLPDIPALPRTPDWLVFCAAPDVRSEAAYRRLYVEGLALAMETLRPACVLLVSSTAVYAQNAGEWVDESSAAEADSFNGRMLREAERLCLGSPRNRVLRLSGITGPGRNMLLNRALLGEGIANVWSNRIHAADAAAALSHLIDRPGDEPLWIASDDRPARQLEVVNWIRAGQGLPALPPFTEAAAGRRVSNARLRAAGWVPRYPSYRESYA